MENTYRVAICKYTGKKVLQIKENKNWLCLHHEDPIDDDKEVEAFIKSKSK